MANGGVCFPSSLPRDQTGKASPSLVSASEERRRHPSFQRWRKPPLQGSFQRLAGEVLAGLGIAREETL